VRSVSSTRVGSSVRRLLKELQGPIGMRTVREMTDNDPVVGSFLFAVEQSIRQVDWKVIPADDSEEARKYANFVDSCRLDMQQTWGDVLTEILSFLSFGWSLMEVTYKVRRGDDPLDLDRSSRYEDGLVGWKKFSPRSQESMRRWIYDQKDKDKLLFMEQFTIEKGMVQIPMERCLHFRTKSLKNNPEGRSILRNAYRPWYLKKRIEEVEGIGIERDMAGLPVLTAPEGMDLWNENDSRALDARRAAEKIVRNIRVDEQMGVLLPFGWDLKLLASGGKRAIPTTDVVNRYDQRIAMTVLADFILLGHTNRMGSFALAKSKTGVFGMSLVGYLNVIRDTFNTHGLPKLWRMNGFKPELMPRLDYTPVDAPPLKDLASYITALSGALVDLTPPALQRFLLQQAGIPADLSDLAGRGGTGEGGPNVADDNDGGGVTKPGPGADPNQPGVRRTIPRTKPQALTSGGRPVSSPRGEPRVR
jgi:hypothetical protein